VVYYHVMSARISCEWRIS